MAQEQPVIRGGGPNPTPVIFKLFILSPTEGAAVVGSNAGVPINVSGNGSVAGVLNEVTVDLGDGKPQVASFEQPGTRDFTWSFNGVTPKGGPITITVNASATLAVPPKGDGDKIVKGITSVNVVPINGGPQTTPGTLTISILSPAEGDAVVAPNAGVPIKVSGNGSVAAAVLKEVKVDLGDGKLQDASVKQPPGTGDFTWSFNGVTPMGGAITITVHASATANGDHSALQKTASVSVVPKKTPISISILSPAEGAAVVGPKSGVPINVSGKGKISGAALDEVTVDLGDGKPIQASVEQPSGTGDFTWSFNGVTPKGGPITITVNASATLAVPPKGDGDKKVKGITSVNVVTNTTPPNLNVSFPPDAQGGTLFTGTEAGFQLAAAGTASDAQFGVESVQWQLDSGSSVAAASSDGFAHWSASIPVPFGDAVGGPQPHTITFICQDKGGNVATVVRTFKVAHPTPPILIVSSPPDAQGGTLFTGTEAGFQLAAAGTASDPQFGGVESVQWQLDSGGSVKALSNDDGFANWNASIQVPPGLHTITFTARDIGGNVATVTRTVTVALPTGILDTTLISYLQALLQFAAQPLSIPGVSNPTSRITIAGRNLSADDLVKKFYQPFQQLNTFTNKAGEPVRQIRLCIEILRGYLKDHAAGDVLSAALAAKELQYRQAAYLALLNQIGTSYDEIRLARSYTPDKRQELADRLSIDLGPASRPDHLDALFLDPTAPPSQAGAVTERILEETFGLVDTTRDPLQAGPPVVELLSWQLQHLRGLWKAQDFPDAAPADASPLIDPDLLLKTDFRNPVNNDPAYSLFLLRQATVQGWFDSLQHQRQGASSPLAGLDAILKAILQKQSSDLLAMDQQRQKGADIGAQLKALHLEVNAFNYLVRICMLVNPPNNVPLLNVEWNDVCSILVQVQKIQAFPAWRAAEKAANLMLGPDYFQNAFQVPRLHTTGVDDNGLPRTDGVVDPNWTITSTPQGPVTLPAFVTYNGAWLPNGRFSRWISPNADGASNQLPGNYTYQTRLDLSAFDPASVALALQVAADDLVADIRLNGASLGLKATGFASFTGLQISSGFVSGVNTLEFIVTNLNAAPPNPTALRVEFLFASAPRLSEPPAWRATQQAQQQWHEALKARIDQEQALIQGFYSAVDTSEEAALPVLRDALLGAIGQDPDWLTQRLLIDVAASSTLKTTRLHQAIETLQALFFALRNRQFEALVPPTELSGWQLTEDQPSFDTEWHSMGTYANWLAAMRVFLYPENLLFPSLRGPSVQSPAFQDFMSAVRQAEPLTRGTVQDLIAVYLGALRARPNNVPAYGDLPAELADPGFGITEQIREKELTGRAAFIHNLWSTYASKPSLKYAYLVEAFYDVPVYAALQLHQAGDFEAALDWYHTVYAYDLPLAQRKIYPGLVDEHAIKTQYQQTPQWLLDDFLNPHVFARSRADAYTRFVLFSIVRCVLSFADSEFTIDSFESLPRARSLYISALELLNLDELKLPPADPRVAMNPIVNALRLHAELSLFKIRTERNIAGMRRPAPVPVSAGDVDVTGAFSNNGGSPGTFGGISLPPTQYRYATLIERAKQLVSLAQQVEGSFQASLEKKDAEAYTILKARQDLDLSYANVKLQQLRLAEAADGVTLAVDQQQKAQFQVDHYQSLLDQGLLGAEQASLDLMWVEFGLQTAAAILYVIAANTEAFSLKNLFASGGGTFQTAAQGLQATASAVGAQVTIQDKLASYERRRQEWHFQHDLSQQDVTITQQQYTISVDHQNVANQEQTIAQSQSAHAQATVEFLANKFTNVELFDWMSGILQRVYSYFLQQATAVARLAQTQLAFERQETALAIIQADYWQSPSSASQAAKNTTPDRRGLTGSARLLQDIFQLDQHAFETNRRKLQLSKTISLAQIAPFEFQRFRQTGVLPFATPRQIFDQDFPGHYLRLIKRVRTSVIALIPPTEGVKATLSSNGVSRATISGDVFKDVVVRRDPQSVALTSPINATGLFEMDTQPELLLPFEGLGVDTSWEFQMPQAANFFDYDSVADVLITIDYTALNDLDYRRQIVQQLDRNFSADRAFSFRQQFADQWYDLHNPDQLDPARRFIASFSTGKNDFPTSLANLTISNVVLAFIGKDSQRIKVTSASLALSPQGTNPNAAPLGGVAASDTGVLSTRSGSATKWLEAIGAKPFGLWKLDLSHDQAVQTALNNDAIQDILFVITYSGYTPAWPL